MLGEPKIGETRLGREIGRRDRVRYIWHACVGCSKEQWVQFSVVDNRPRSTRCRSCAAKEEQHRAQRVRDGLETEPVLPMGAIVKEATELGYKGHARHIWTGCPRCGRKRWVQMQLNRPERTICHSCASRIRRRPDRKMEKHHMWKGGRKRDSKGYIRLKHHTHPRRDINNYVFEHIVIWEQANGRILPKGWAVHHLNGIPDDNRPENLVAMPRKRHDGLPKLPDILKARIRELESKVQELERSARRGDTILQSV